jgi:UrcA family protein
MKALRSSIITTAVVALLAGTALQASAQDSTNVTAQSLQKVQSVTVDISDLNLNSPKGQEVLLNRISRAADQVCGARDTRRAGDLAQASRNRACYKASMSRAMSKVSASAVASAN